MDAETYRRVEEVALKLLAKADVADQMPTPLDDVLAAAGLHEPDESLLAPEQFARAPAHIKGIVAKLAGKVRGLVDRRAREVHFDPSITLEGKRRFWKSHEIMHVALPWQRDLAYADDDYRLSHQVRQEFDLEANQGGAELLYQGKRFANEAADLAVGLTAVIALSQRYHVSIQSAMWRFVATNGDVMLAVVLDPSPVVREPLRYQRHELIRSVPFIDRFGSGIWPGQLDAGRFSFLNEAAAAGATQGVVEGVWRRRDLAGGEVSLRTECLATPYAILVLAWIPKKRFLRRKLKLVA